MTFREQTGDLFALTDVDAICLTTNGVVSKCGACVMGRGVALQAKQRWPGVDYLLGRAIQQNGNIVHQLTGIYGLNPGVPMLWDEVCIGGSPDSDGIVLPWHLVAFPVKNHWREPASLVLIERSAIQLAQLADLEGWRRIALPRPGCGNGRRRWDEVAPVLSRMLDDRFIVIHEDSL